MLEGLTRADLAFRAEEAELEELFRTAWRATLRVMLPDPSTLRPEVERSIRLSNAALDLLLFDFLNELLYIKDAEGLLLDLGRLRVGGAAGGYLLEAEACGQAADPARHELGADVKAVTLHRLAVERTPRGWQATVVLDV
mgnify:CR=1 FL=1